MATPVVVVTGGGRGIGRAICMRFAKEGAEVVAAARSSDQLGETRDLIRRLGGRCSVQTTDVSCGDEVDALISVVASSKGRIDVLVNNAGTAWLGKVQDLEQGVFERIVSVNMTAVYRACRAVFPVMRRQGGGVIINISSAASVDPFPGFAAYGASKAWVNTWTTALAEEGRPAGIRVFAVSPGAVETDMLRGAFPDFPAEKCLEASDVADVVYTLAQPSCRHASGQVISVSK